MVYHQGSRYDRDDEPPFSLDDYPNLRGVIDFDTNYAEVMVDAGVVEVAEAVAEMTGGAVAPYEVADAELEGATAYSTAFRLIGVGWTYLHQRSNRRPAALLDRPDQFTEDDLAALSGRLGARLIQFGVSDTAAAVYYSFYDQGVLRELFDAAEDQVFRFQSSDRRVDFEGVDLEEFADRFLLSQDALFAGAGFGGYKMKGLKPAALPAEFESARFVIIPPGEVGTGGPESPGPKPAPPKPKRKSSKPKN